MTFTIDYNQLKNFAASLKKVQASALSKADGHLGRFGLGLYRDIVYRSPVDKNAYRSDWMFEKVGMGEYHIYNRTIQSLALEQGSVPGKSPWPRPTTPLLPDQKRWTNESKTIEKDGAIWSTQMPEPVAGGAVDNADWEQLDKDMIDGVIKIDF